MTRIKFHAKIVLNLKECEKKKYNAKNFMQTNDKLHSGIEEEVLAELDDY